jgi:hypothetical protein
MLRRLGSPTPAFWLRLGTVMSSRGWFKSCFSCSTGSSTGSTARGQATAGGSGDALTSNLRAARTPELSIYSDA